MQRQAGFSILELMIALMLGLVVVAGIVQLFVGNSRTYDIVNAQSRLQENARYSFDFITEAARTAGYFGCAPEPDFIIKGLTGNWNVIPEYDMSRPVDGFESNGDGTYGPNNLLTLPRSTGSTNVNVHINGNGIDNTELDTDSDILIFRSVRQPVNRLLDTVQPTGEPVAYTPAGAPTFAVNDVVVLSDCEQAAMFRVTGITAGADRQTLARDTAAAGNNYENSATVNTLGEPLEIIPATLSVLGRPYGAMATISQLESTYFFIAPSTQANNAGVNIPALWRKVGREAPVELVQGVENMQVFYGVDTTGDNVANVNRYITADQITDPGAIVAVRVRLDVSSPDLVAEAGDRMRRTFSKTISVRNLGF